MFTPYQAKSYAYDLTAKKTGSERLSASLMEAEIETSTPIRLERLSLSCALRSPKASS